MNENEKTPFDPEEKENNESLDNSEADKNTEQNTAEHTEPEDSSGDTVNDTQAFNWEWTDSEAEPTAEPETDTEPEISAEPETDTEPEISAEPETDSIKTEAQPERKKRFTALHLSCILSACSIVLLVAFALSLMLGFFPVKHSVNNVVNQNSTVPDTDIEPTVLEDFLNSVVVVKGTGVTSTSTGTGVIISENGYIITNYHVIEDCSSVTVELYGEITAEKAVVVGYHEDDDVAVLKIERTGLRAAAFVDSKAVRYGEKVYAIGTPEGTDYSWSVTQGVVSCPERQLMIYDSEGVLEKKMIVVQTDAPVNHGNSGGPLINVRGEVVGIVTLKRSDSAGMGFALPATGVLIDANAIIENGHADDVSSGISLPRPLLGITGVGVVEGTFYESFSNEEGSGVNVVDEAYAAANPNTTFYAAKSGVYVSATSAGSDASKHLKEGDIVTEVNGNTVSTIYQVMDIINKFNGGDTVSVTYFRAGKYYTVTLALRSAS